MYLFCNPGRRGCRSENAYEYFRCYKPRVKRMTHITGASRDATGQMALLNRSL